MVKKIIPCVCIDHKPDASDSNTYGMPLVTVSQVNVKHHCWWVCFCPQCKKGTGFEQKNVELALKKWNEMQKELWMKECVELRTGALRVDVPAWKVEFFTDEVEKVR